MVASVTKSNPARLGNIHFPFPVFLLKYVRQLTCLFVTVCILTGQSLAEDGEFMEEFLKREYSLAKPYRGKFAVNKLLWVFMSAGVS